MSASHGRARMASLDTVSEDNTGAPDFDVVAHYEALLLRDDGLPMPVAAISSLAELISRCSSTTIQELLILINQAEAKLQAASYNPISLTCGSSLLKRFLTLQRLEAGLSFREFKSEITDRAREFVKASPSLRSKIVDIIQPFLEDGSTILVHSYSRVVVQALLRAHEDKKRFNVYITEARPFGLGLKTHAILSAAGVSCSVILDSAVAYILGKVDYVLVGSEAVCESGALINFIGSYGLSVLAKASHTPVYALAESYKFTRLFPLSQYDIPSAKLNSNSFPIESKSTTSIPTPVKPMSYSPHPIPLQMSATLLESQPLLDLTPASNIELIFSDLGVMMPSGISDALLAIYGGE